MWWEIARDVLAAAAALVGVLSVLVALLSRLVKRLRGRLLPGLGKIVYRLLVPPEQRRPLGEEERVPGEGQEPFPREKPVTRDLTYVDVAQAVAELAGEVRHYQPDVLGAVDRGGAVVAGLLAKKLKQVREILPIVVVQRRETPSGPDYEVTGDVGGKRLVLVDDAFRTGAAMTLARERVLEKGARHIKMVVILLERRERRRGTAATASDVLAVYHTDRLNVNLPWDVEPFVRQ